MPHASVPSNRYVPPCSEGEGSLYFRGAGCGPVQLVSYSSEMYGVDWGPVKADRTVTDRAIRNRYGRLSTFPRVGIFSELLSPRYSAKLGRGQCRLCHGCPLVSMTETVRVRPCLKQAGSFQRLASTIHRTLSGPYTLSERSTRRALKLSGPIEDTFLTE